jgi:peptide/nickel transport system permease protein
VTGHAFRNASIPILTLGGNELASLVNGAVIVETVFGWPGIGQLLIQAIERRDLPLVSAIVFVIAAMTLVINIAIDLAYTKLDPRISMTGSQGGGH